MEEKKNVAGELNEAVSENSSHLITYGDAAKIPICKLFKNDKNDLFMADFRGYDDITCFPVYGRYEKEAESNLLGKILNEEPFYTMVFKNIIAEWVNNNLLGDNVGQILTAVHFVIDQMVAHPEERKAILFKAYEHLSEIKEHCESYDFGGAFVPNKYFVGKALWTIENYDDEKCMCANSFDEAGVRKYLFQELSEPKKVDNYTKIYTLRCPVCHTIWQVTEKYTMGHVSADYNWEAITIDSFLKEKENNPFVKTNQ